jgi:hypothetical protein
LPLRGEYVLRYFQSTRNYTVLLPHPSGVGSVAIPKAGWVEGNFFSKFAALKEGKPPANAVISFSESDFIMKGASAPVHLPPIVKPHTLKPAVEPVSVTPAKPAPKAAMPEPVVPAVPVTSTEPAVKGK